MNFSEEWRTLQRKNNDGGHFTSSLASHMGGRLSRRTNERRGEDNIVEALAVQFPDMFHAEILSKLGLEDTLTLSLVSKKCWRAVWSEAGVRRMKAMTDDLAEGESQTFQSGVHG